MWIVRVMFLFYMISSLRIFILELSEMNPANI